MFFPLCKGALNKQEQEWMNDPLWKNLKVVIMLDEKGLFSK
jgi:hypothetical protein